LLFNPLPISPSAGGRSLKLKFNAPSHYLEGAGLKARVYCFPLYEGGEGL